MLKKLVKVVALCTALILLVTGCGSKPIVETKMSADFGGVNQVLTFFSQGDQVLRQTTVNSASFTTLGVTTAEEAKALLDPTTAKFWGINGLTHSITYFDDHVVENLEVDFTVADLNEISNITGSQFEGDVSKGISLKKTLEVLEAQGFTKVQ